MSTESIAPHGSPLKPPPAKAGWQRRRRSTVTRGGITMLARGEPMVWLTGGSLAICLLMIVGLLILIVVQGVGTFWPQPVVQVTLRDGRVYLGEVTRREQFELTGVMAETLPDEIAQAARQVLAGREEAPAHRRLIRTGNFELTNEDFNWVADFEVAADGRTHPEWAVTVERIEWGRFYGMPHEFALTHRRLVPADEETLDEIVKFFERQRGLFAEDLQPPIDRALASLQAELEQVRARSVKAIAEKFPPVDGERLDAVIQDGEVVPLREVQPDQNVYAVTQVWEGSPAAWRKFTEHHAAARRRFREIYRMERHDVGTVNRRLEDSRLAVRAQERLTGLDVLPKAAELIQLNVQLSAFERDRKRNDELLSRMEKTLPADSPLTASARHWIPSLNKEIQQQMAEPRRRIASLEAQLAAMPPPVQQAVQTYLETEAAAQTQTERIVSEIDELRRENERYELRMETAQGPLQTLMVGDVVRAYPANQLTWWNKLKIYASRWAEFLLDDPREANFEGGVFPAIWGTVAMTLIMSLAVVPFGVLAALYLREYARSGVAVSAVRIAINNLAGVPSIVFGVFGLGFFCYIIGVRIDELFFSASLPNPTYGKGGLLWASLTLALMTLPVVIVATEEALAAVPNSMREGSYACGASKWQTIQRIVLPRAMPGIMTGTILAMARGAGEVAPLMLVGAVKLAPELPVDGLFPYIHGDRSFMHLGFHIFDLGFQSRNSEAAKPMVYTTTLLLILIIAILNLAAIWLRGRLRRRFQVSQF